VTIRSLLRTRRLVKIQQSWVIILKTNDEETLFTPKAKDIDLTELFQIIKQQIWIVALTTVILSGLGYWYSTHHKVTLQYSSSTRLIVGATSDQMSTLLVMFNDPTILSKVSDQIGNKRSLGNLANEISATSINNSQVINLTVTDPDPRLAAEIANKDAEMFAQEVPKLVNFNKIRQLTPAQVNLLPVNQTLSYKYILYGMIAGLVLGIFLGFFRNSFDESIRSEKELERLLGSPVIGSISKMTKKNSRKYVTRRFFLFHFIEGVFRSKDSPSKKEKHQGNPAQELKREEGLSKANNE
jgi:capsular polysaccharide biosynthesis protein